MDRRLIPIELKAPVPPSRRPGPVYFTRSLLIGNGRSLVHRGIGVTIVRRARAPFRRGPLSSRRTASQPIVRNSMMIDDFVIACVLGMTWIHENSSSRQ